MSNYELLTPPKFGCYTHSYNVKKIDNMDGTSKIYGNCVCTGEMYECIVPTEGINKRLKGENIQDCMPNVSKENREFIISGMSPDGWKNLYKGINKNIK